MMNAFAACFLGAALVLITPEIGACQASKRTSGGHTVPNLNAKAACQDVTTNGLSKTKNFDGCMNDEREARAQLEKDWGSFPVSMHEQCLHLVTPPALPSYVTLRECLTMAREAEKLPKGIPPAAGAQR